MLYPTHCGKMEVCEFIYANGIDWALSMETSIEEAVGKFTFM